MCEESSMYDEINQFYYEFRRDLSESEKEIPHVKVERWLNDGHSIVEYHAIHFSFTGDTHHCDHRIRLVQEKETLVYLPLTNIKRIVFFNKKEAAEIVWAKGIVTVSSLDHDAV